MQYRSRSAPRLRPTRTLLPGDLYCDREPQYLGTVLGSCVSVCLWDMQLRFGGMNHFLLPNRPSNCEASCRFGDIAVPELVDRMLALGSNLRHIQAKLFGGAYVLRAGSPEYAVGRRNVEIAVAVLRERKIPIVASRLSGTQGLVIRQCTDCGKVWARPVGNLGKAPQPRVQIHELPCFSEDIAAAMIICTDEGLPVTVRSRQAPDANLDCDTCAETPAGWRQT